ncbi:MAG TPA: IS1182 family transposase [Stellaceae bacterium]|nr:IS1182 family transposase [Stellaceae bacterium]
MCLKPESMNTVPEETTRIARAAYPKGNIYLQLRDEFGTIYEDKQFVDLYPRRGQPAEAPWRLALVCVMQFREGLSDRQAANAVRGRLDWKYLLGLELSNPGFDSSVLSEFRQRFLTNEREVLIFDLFLTQLRDRGYLKMRGQQRTDSTHVLAKIRSLNRVEVVGETFRAVLNTLAVAAPEWLKEQWQEAWIERYEHRVEDYRLPDGKQARQEYAVVIGKDGTKLLDALYADTTPTWLRELPLVQTLRRIWVQNFYWEEGELRWRDLSNVPAAGELINSPYDPEALYAQKRESGWRGWKVHLTETCDEDSPHLITHVETTPAPQADDDALPHIHQALAAHDLLPEQHIVDTGYVDAQELVNSRQDYHVDLFGPTRLDYHWQARENSGFAASQFSIDWQEKCATCPAGKISQSWTPAKDRRGHPVIKIKFAVKDCRSCPSRSQCTQSQSDSPRRTLTVRPEPQYQALQTARERQATEAFKTAYDKRAGIEGTLSQSIRAFGLRQARYQGLAKVHLQHVFTATALNFTRIFAWRSQLPRAQTRQAAFVRLVKKGA